MQTLHTSPSCGCIGDIHFTLARKYEYARTYIRTTIIFDSLYMHCQFSISHSNLYPIYGRVHTLFYVHQSINEICINWNMYVCMKFWGENRRSSKRMDKRMIEYRVLLEPIQLLWWWRYVVLKTRNLKLISVRGAGPYTLLSSLNPCQYMVYSSSFGRWSFLQGCMARWTESFRIFNIVYVCHNAIFMGLVVMMTMVSI